METGGDEENMMCFCGEDREFKEMVTVSCVRVGSTSLYAIQKGRGYASEKGLCVLLLSFIEDVVAFARGRGAEE